MTRPERIEAFEAELNTLISAYADVLAPRDCSICERDEDCTHAAEETGQAVEGIMQQDWLLVHRWGRMDGDGGYWEWVTSDSLLMVESVGVLTVVLDDARDRVRRSR